MIVVILEKMHDTLLSSKMLSHWIVLLFKLMDVSRKPVILKSQIIEWHVLHLNIIFTILTIATTMDLKWANQHTLGVDCQL